MAIFPKFLMFPPPRRKYRLPFANLLAFIGVLICIIVPVFSSPSLRLCPADLASKCKCGVLSDGELDVSCSFISNFTSLSAALSAVDWPIRRLAITDTALDSLPEDALGGATIRELTITRSGLVRLDDLSAVFGQGRNQTNQSDAFAALESLNLGGNRLGSVPGGLDAFPNLLSIDLTDNGIKSVPIGAFAGLAFLQHLRLSRNKICTLDRHAFNETKSTLTLLDLSRNCFNRVPARNIRGFQRLSWLDMSHNLVRGELPQLQFVNLAELRDLWLDGNQVVSLAPMAFMNVPRLRRLSLADNVISVLDPNQFHPFEAVESLDLSGNRLRKILSSSFRDMPRLAQVNLERNEISHVETTAFSNLPNLRLLNLQGNKISKMELNVFDQLPTLTMLLLQNNTITEIDQVMLSGAPNLQRLNLRHNAISRLSQGAFDLVPRLTTLDLGHNRLTSLPRNLFNYHGKMFWLDIDNNQLETFEPNTFSQRIANLLIYGNPLRCDSNLDWFIDYLVNNRIRTFLPTHGEVVCASPEDKAGTRLKDLMIAKANETLFQKAQAAKNIQNFIPKDLIKAGLASAGGGQSGNVPLQTLFGPNINKLLQPSAGAANPAQQGVQPARQLPTSIGGINVQNIPPQMINHVLKGGQIPGVPPAMLRQLVSQYLQQQQQPVGNANAGIGSQAAGLRNFPGQAGGAGGFNTGVAQQGGGVYNGFANGPPVAPTPAGGPVDSPGFVLDPSARPSVPAEAGGNNGPRLYFTTPSYDNYYPQVGSNGPYDASNSGGYPGAAAVPTLPPLESLDPSLVQTVLSGGTIPGMSPAQVNALRNYYTAQILNPGQNSGGQIGSGWPSGDTGGQTALPRNLITAALPSNNFPGLGSLPLPGLDLSRLSPEVLQALARGQLPDLSEHPEFLQIIQDNPGLLTILDTAARKRKQDKAKQHAAGNGKSDGRNNSLSSSEAIDGNSVRDGYGRGSNDYADEESANRGYNLDAIQKAQNTIGRAHRGGSDVARGDALWITGIVVTITGILTIATVAVVCVQRHRRRRLIAATTGSASTGDTSRNNAEKDPIFFGSGGERASPLTAMGSSTNIFGGPEPPTNGSNTLSLLDEPVLIPGLCPPQSQNIPQSYQHASQQSMASSNGGFYTGTNQNGSTNNNINYNNHGAKNFNDSIFTNDFNQYSTPGSQVTPFADNFDNSNNLNSATNYFNGGNYSANSQGRTLTTPGTSIPMFHTASSGSGIVVSAPMASDSGGARSNWVYTSGGNTANICHLNNFNSYQQAMM